MIRLQRYDVQLESEDFLNWLSQMAQDGWFIRKLEEDQIFLRFDQGTPQNLKYSLFFHGFRKLPNEEFLEAALEQGWTLIGRQDAKAGLLLFKSDWEDPLPLETDLEEITAKVQRMSRSFAWNAVYYVFIALVWMLLAQRNPESNQSNWILVFLYGLIGIQYGVSFYRFRGLEDPDHERRRRRANLSRTFSRLLPVTVGIVMVMILYQSLSHWMVPTGLIPSELVEPLEFPGKAKTLNLWLKTSRFSFDPAYDFFYQIEDKDGYTQSLYQTKTPVFVGFSKPSLESFMDASKTYWSTDFNSLKLMDKTEDRLTYGTESEYLSLKLVGSDIYSLHSVNLSLQEHLEVLDQMGDPS